MKTGYILALDQGTTGTRAIIFDHNGDLIDSAYLEIKQHFPEPGWVEHDPTEIWNKTRECIEKVLSNKEIPLDEIRSIGITNQRESIVLWDKDTGKPLYNSINWQCRRSSSICDELKKRGYEKTIRDKTGLFIDPYFSATKIMWVMRHVKGMKEKFDNGSIRVGNIDSWLIWNLSGGRNHVTDYSNASRTMLFNINTLQWDDEILKITGIPRAALPDVKPSSGSIGTACGPLFDGREIPITGVAGDQQSAAFGQACFNKGMIKSTYGTCLSMVMNIGSEPKKSENGLTTDLAWNVGGNVTYALEGGIFIGGAVLKWLKDGLRIIKNESECDPMARKVADTGGVYLVPGFTGLGAPYWDPYARGVIIGITRGTTAEHIVRSALESIAYQTKDIIDAMASDSGAVPESLRVDGNVTQSEFTMQFQSDILGIPLEKPVITEMSALGACFLAGLGVGLWDSTKDLDNKWKLQKRYEPKMSSEQREELYYHWKRAVKRSLKWQE